MNLPAHDLPAEDVHDEVKVEEHTRDGSGHTWNVPAPAAWQRMFTCARMRLRRVRSPYNWWVVCARPAALHVPGDAVAPLRAAYGRSWILRPDIAPDQPASARSGSVAGWRTPRNCRCPAPLRVPRRSACWPVRGVARGGVDRAGSRRHLSSAARCSHWFPARRRLWHAAHQR